MSQQHQGRGARRVLAILGTAALALGGALAASNTAVADEPTPPPPGNIVGTTGTLHLHKHAGNPVGAGDGQAINDDNLGIGINNITFTIERVTNGSPATPIDLTTTAGWGLAKTASDGFGASTGALPAGFGVTPATIPSVTTAGGGLAEATLPFGLYRVTEQASTAVETPAQPFLVTLPYPSAGAWLYDVHVYPKNQLKDVPTKTVAEPLNVLGDPAVVEGSLVTWTITAPVPRVAGNEVTKFVIEDQLDNRLKYEHVVVKLDEVTLVEGADTYSVLHTGADADGQGGKVTVTLIGDTLDNLQTGQIVIIELTTSDQGYGEITNTAVRNVNEVDTEIGTPQTNWGKIRVVKSNASGVKLTGAKFELYESDKTTKVYNETSTDGDGVILFDALWLGNNTDKTENYCLKETQAPPGYITPQGGAAWTCVDVTTADAAIKEVAITNTQQTGPNLPLTGSSGTALFMAGGLALIATAAGGGLMAARRRSEGRNRQ